MKKIFILLMIFGFSKAYSQEKNFIDKPYIEIIQSEDTLVTPNEIYLSYTLNESNLKQYPNLDAVEDIIFKEFERLNLSPIENLKVVSADNFIKKEFLKGKYSVANKNFELKVNEIQNVNKVFKFLDSIGLISVKLERMNYNKTKESIDLLILRACKNAKTKASQMASSVGKQIGEVIYLQSGATETDNDFRPFRGNNYYRYNESFGVAGGLNDKFYIDIQMQKIKIKTSILLRIEIK